MPKTEIPVYRFRTRSSPRAAWKEHNGVFAADLNGAPVDASQYPVTMANYPRYAVEVRVKGGDYVPPADLNYNGVYLTAAGLVEVSAVPASAELNVVKAAVALAHKKVWDREPSAATMLEAVKLPADTHRAAELGRAVVVIFTEHGNLSQYDNDAFWRHLRAALNKSGLYYEWHDGGTATIWRK